MSVIDEPAKIHAVLQHLGCGEDLASFPATASEKVALIRIAANRRLIAWHRARGRYELTGAGWSELGSGRRFGLLSLMASTAAGAVIGAVVLGIFWLSSDASTDLAAKPPARAVWRTEKAAVAPAFRPANTRTAGDTAAVPPPAAAPAPAAVPPAPPILAEQPVTEEPPVVAPPPKVKHARARKPRDRTARHRRENQRTARHRRDNPGPTWAAVDPWRQQGSWMSYR
jgi:hypothetical protein